MMRRRGNSLREWRLRQKVNGKTMTMEQAAAQIGVTRACWNDWEKGNRTPAHTLMIEIFSVTGGEVTPNDFYDLPHLQVRNAA